jgi:hypothetical protein
VVDHLLINVSQHTEGQKTLLTYNISTYDEEVLSLFVYHDRMSIGGVKGGKRCRFYASDRDVNYETDDGIAEYPCHDLVEKYMQERILWVLLM